MIRLGDKDSELCLSDQQVWAIDCQYLLSSSREILNENSPQHIGISVYISHRALLTFIESIILSFLVSTLLLGKYIIFTFTSFILNKGIIF